MKPIGGREGAPMTLWGRGPVSPEGSEPGLFGAKSANSASGLISDSSKQRRDRHENREGETSCQDKGGETNPDRRRIPRGLAKLQPGIEREGGVKVARPAVLIEKESRKKGACQRKKPEGTEALGPARRRRDYASPHREKNLLDFEKEKDLKREASPRIIQEEVELFRRWRVGGAIRKQKGRKRGKFSHLTGERGREKDDAGKRGET